MVEVAPVLDDPVEREHLTAGQVVVAIAAFVAIAVAFLCTLNASPLIEPDEPRYAEVAREMLVRGDWITPTLNFVKYFEKPPLVYWLIALNLAIFGQQDWAVRFWSAVFGLLGVMCTAYLAWRMFGFRVGVVAAAILASMPLYFGISQVASPDMPLAALCTACLVCAWVIHSRDEGGRERALVACFWIALALAVLAKGPVAAVLVFGTIGTYALVAREFAPWVRLFWLPGLALFSAITLPWFVLVTWNNPEFARFFFFEQHVLRYAQPWEHRQPPWFYIPVVLLGAFPWWLIGLYAWRRVKTVAGGTSRIWRAEHLYLLCWFAVVFVFFSLSGSKLGTYILPALPPLAMLFAHSIVKQIDGLGASLLKAAGASAIVLGLGLLAAARLAPVLSTHHRAERLPPALLVGAAVLVVGGVLLSRLESCTRQRPWIAVAGLAGLLLSVEVATFRNRGVAEHYTPLAQAIRQQWKPGDRIVLYRHYTQGIPYYTGRRVVVVRSWGELDFGRRQGDHTGYFWEDDDRLVREWNRGGRMFLVLNRSALADLAGHLEPSPRPLAHWGKKVVVVNF
ncbi:MAG: glycosyltransferase family 39 protein [Candidatus Binatia bacterium]|nr:glycosyltransferase family 39 protein [Candidatus Binatia bacterium]